MRLRGVFAYTEDGNTQTIKVIVDITDSTRLVCTPWRIVLWIKINECPLPLLTLKRMLNTILVSERKCWCVGLCLKHKLLLMATGPYRPYMHVVLPEDRHNTKYYDFNHADSIPCQFCAIKKTGVARFLNFSPVISRYLL